jgi:hypothetical protein
LPNILIYNKKKRKEKKRKEKKRKEKKKKFFFDCKCVEKLRKFPLEKKINFI